MTRALPTIAFLLIASLLAGLALTLLEPQFGFLGVNGAGRVALDGNALLGAGHAKTFADFVTVFPPLPFMLTTAVAFLGGPIWSVSPVSPAMVASAMVGGALILCWFAAMRNAYPGGFGRAVLTLLLVINPLFLTALSSGPAAPLTMLGFWMLGVGAFELRRQAIAGDAITVAVGLCVIGFSSAYGLALAIGCLPFLAFAAPGELLNRSAIGFLLSMTFPFFAALLGFAMIAWIFTGDGWAVLAGSLDQSAKGAAEDTLAAAVFALVAILIVAPIAPIALLRASQRLQLLMPTLALVATLVTGFAMARSFGVLRDPALGIAPALSLAALSAARWPKDQRWRTPLVALLLLAGAVGGAFAALSVKPPPTLQAVGDQLSDRALGLFLRGKSDILMDSEAAPSVIAARASAQGLVGPADQGFTLALLRRRPSAAYVAVSGDELDLNDRIAKGIPKIYDKGAPGYALIYDRDGWRVYARQSAQAQTNPNQATGIWGG
jgi:hypothetical protein